MVSQSDGSIGIIATSLAALEAEEAGGGAIAALLGVKSAHTLASQDGLRNAGFTQVGSPTDTDEGPVLRFERKRGR